MLSDFLSYTMMHFLFFVHFTYKIRPKLVAHVTLGVNYGLYQTSDATGKVALERISFWKKLENEQKLFLVMISFWFWPSLLFVLYHCVENRNGIHGIPCLAMVSAKSFWDTFITRATLFYNYFKYTYFCSVETEMQNTKI